MAKLDEIHVDDLYAGDEWRDERLDSVEIGDFLAYLPDGAYIFRPTGATWRAKGVNARLPKIGDLLPSVWLDRNVRVEQRTWVPGQPQLIEDKLYNEEGAWIPKRGCTVYNQYRPPSIELGDASKAGPWLDLVAKLYPDDVEHILNFFAQRRQQPFEKINHMLVMGGAPGIGKDSIITAVSRAVGPWNFKSIPPHAVTAPFNAYLQAVIVLITELRDLGDINRVAFYETTKAMLASPPAALCINEKHVKAYWIPNVCGVVATTNYKTEGLYLPADDRRHYIAWSNRETEWRSEKRWSKYHRWLDAGGDRHVAAYLQQRDLAQFNPKAPPKKTAAFWEIVGASQMPEEAELSDALEPLAGGAVTLEDVAQQADSLGYTGLAEFFRDRSRRRILAGRMDKAGYIRVDNPDAEDRLWKIDGRRQAVYGPKHLSLQEVTILARERAEPSEAVRKSQREFRKTWRSP